MSVATFIDYWEGNLEYQTGKELRLGNKNPIRIITTQVPQDIHDIILHWPYGKAMETMKNYYKTL